MLFLSLSDQLNHIKSISISFNFILFLLRIHINNTWFFYVNLFLVQPQLTTDNDLVIPKITARSRP